MMATEISPDAASKPSLGETLRAALRAILVAAMVVAFAAGAFGAARAAEPDVVRIGVATAGGGDPITWGGSPGGVARAFGWLEEAFSGTGTRVEWLFFKGAGPAVNEALSNKQIDLAYQGDLPSIVGRANGLRTKLLLSSGQRNNLYVVVPPDSDIRSVPDLKGRTVSIFRGTNGHLVANKVLAEAGLRERDIRGVNLDTGSAQAALVSKGVDAAFGGFEYFKLRDQGLAKIVYSTRGQDPKLTRQAHLHGREAFIAEHPETVQRVVDVFVRAADWASDENNRDALFRIWARSGVPQTSFAAEFEGQSLAVRNSPLLDDFIIARYRAVVREAQDLRLIRRDVTIEDWIDRRFLTAALKKQGLESRWTPSDADGRPQLAKLAATPPPVAGAAAAGTVHGEASTR